MSDEDHPSTVTRLAGSSNDSSSPLSPFDGAGKSDSFGSAAVHRRKQSNNAEDNRRVAIVPLPVDQTVNYPGPVSGDETGQFLPTTLPLPLPLPLAGRALVVDAQLAASGSALVAPPDAKFSLHDIPFSSPTPSSSSSTPPTTPKNQSSISPAQLVKSRSLRAFGHSKSSSRDIGIVGTRRDLLPQELAAISSQSQDTSSDYRPPIFQTPNLRSPSPIVNTAPNELDSSTQNTSPPSTTAHAPPPAAMATSVEPAILGVSPAINGHIQSHSALSLAASSLRQQPISTADQGQPSPSSTSTTISTAPSSFLYYQPGVHSKAGPLPPPPRAMFDIDFNAPPPPRPPRLRSPSPLDTKKVAGGSTTPASVTVKLASRASLPSIHQIHIATTPPIGTQSSSSGSSSYSE
jgi:hypothetical protein